MILATCLRTLTANLRVDRRESPAALCVVGVIDSDFSRQLSGQVAFRSTIPGQLPNITTSNYCLSGQKSLICLVTSQEGRTSATPT